MHLIMFDIDGTLVNSNGFDEACYLKAAQIVLGIDISSNWEDYSFVTDAGILDEVLNKNNISGSRDNIHQKFKNVFTELISEHILMNPESVDCINGATEFIQYLQNRKDIKIAFATGGWEDTAKLKLKAVNIDASNCAFASSSDHYNRIEIMKVSESRASSNILFNSKTYFGDASWDREASEHLNYRFVLVGNRIKHQIQIDDYQDKKGVLSVLNL